MRQAGKVLHLFGWDEKFTTPYVEFVNTNFESSDHLFVVYGNATKEKLYGTSNVKVCENLIASLPYILREMYSSRKIILHGLFSSHLLYILALFPWLPEKSYWAIWGGDLYAHESRVKDWRWRKNEWLRKKVISRLGHFITYIEGEYQLAKQWYGAKGQLHECFTYTSNIYKPLPEHIRSDFYFNVLVGNSADPSNNHIEILDKLKKQDCADLRIYCPLSYGDSNHAQVVAEYGIKLFGDRFVPLENFMPLEEYNKLLSNIDVAVFNHRRQQGFGNIVSLLGHGKKVFIHPSVTTWEFLVNNGYDVFNTTELPDGLRSEFNSKNNKQLVESMFSSSSLKMALSEIFQSKSV